MVFPPDLPEDKRALYSSESILAVACAYSASIQPPSPDQRVDSLETLASTESAHLFRCVLKRPNFRWLKVEGEWMGSGKITEISFSNELRLLRTVRPHVNIVRFLGAVDGMGLLMEQVEGVELAVHLEASFPIALETKIHWINQMIDALCHIHSFSLSHGDISPGNVLVTPSNVIKLVDFGRSAMKGERLFPTTNPFDPRENNKPEADPILIDAYAFGVLVLCIDAGEYLEIAAVSRAKDFGRLILEFVQPIGIRKRINLAHRIPVTFEA